MTTTPTDPTRPGPLGRHLDEIIADAKAHPIDRDAYDPTDDVAEARAGARSDVWANRIPPRFVEATIDDLELEVAHDVAEWVACWPRRNLVLLGPVGVGKTHAAVAAARQVHFDRGAFVTFVPVVELLDAMRPDGDRELVTRCEQSACLILDDMGSERATDWTSERMYALVNRRWLNELPTIVTANLPPDTLADALGERMYSRLAHDAVAIRVPGADRRRA